jgi:hypothetical protein
VEHGTSGSSRAQQRLFQRDGGGRFGADHQHLLLAGESSSSSNRFDARVELGPGSVVAFELLEDLLG